MFSRKKISDIRSGDRFIKVGAVPATTWRVESVWTATDGILHARLTAAPARSELRTISVAALGNRDEWLPVVAKDTDQ